MSFDVPDACTLPAAEQPLRLAEFDDLFATSVRRVDPVSTTQAPLHLTGPAGLTDRVRDLAARETSCRSFVTFTTTPQEATGGEAVVLDVEIPAAHADMLGLGADTLVALAAGQRDGDCPGTQRLLVDAVTARLDQVQADLAVRNRQAVEAGPGTAARATELSASASLSEDAARLQAVFDVDLAGTVGRLAAAEYRCCSFGSYTLIVDGSGLRLEIRMPAGAAGTLAAVVGLPDVPAGDGDAR
ncbi:hypothetical protein [Micromonospora sp. CPCC 206061]|uniref:hypothetical protein n=1 Tax=Micromonospora sp. CPCC 206061 TaxID=3122410 RepID=UPI002FF42BBB